jgi:hypothetical protein
MEGIKMLCPAGQFDNLEGAKFCKKCGAALVKCIVEKEEL